MKTILHYGIWAVMCGGLLALVLYPGTSRAQPVFEARTEAVRIVLYDEPCTLPEVTNLKLRAVWTENGKDFEGCWSAMAPLGVVMGYFADKTVAAIPMSAFQRVVGV